MAWCVPLMRSMRPRNASGASACTLMTGTYAEGSTQLNTVRHRACPERSRGVPAAAPLADAYRLGEHPVQRVESPPSAAARPTPVHGTERWYLWLSFTPRIGSTVP